MEVDPKRIQTETMPTLTIKNVPEELHERLKERADRHRRSMNSEAIWILEQVLTPSRPSAEEAIARAEALNDRIGTTFDADLIERGKREGRA
jgi:plasmid stability protein